MAVLPDADRVAVWAELMRKYSDDRLSCSITKADLRAAVNAIDAFFDTNAAAINAALPQPARASLTTAQKALLLMYVVQRRYLSGV